MTPKNFKKKNIFKETVKLFFEFGQLQRVRHMGYTLKGVPNPVSVAEHSLRSAQIGYVLAILEGADSHKVAAMCVFHDVPETRFNDLHRIATRYISYFDLKKAEMNIAKDQASQLPGKAQEKFADLMKETDGRKTLEAMCAKDADYLEQAVTGKEYVDIGYKGCWDMLKNVKKALKTKSAKKLLEIIAKTDRNEWWHGLKDLSEVLKK